MQILSVNIAKAEPIEAKSGTSGIFKKPQSGPVAIEELGLANDAIVDLESHGGRDQAVYLYGQPDYHWWSSELNQEPAPGTFGENLTVSELESATINVGDRFFIGDIILEATSPRIPCVTLAKRMNDPKFPKKFLTAKRVGVYCRVLKTGKITAGDNVEFVPYTGVIIPINDMLTNKPLTPEVMRQQLTAPVHEETRADHLAKLAEG